VVLVLASLFVEPVIVDFELTAATLVLRPNSLSM